VVPAQSPNPRRQQIAPRPGAPAMTPQQKAAVIVRLLLAEGVDPGLNKLQDNQQEVLAREMADMRYITKDTLRWIVSEFASELDSVGLHFPPGLSGALSVLDGFISPNTADVLRDESGAEISGNPWERLAGLEVAKLRPIVEQESIEICAVLLSKLSVPKAAELLAEIPPERGRRIAYAVSLTGEIDPETVARIGLALGRQLDAQPGEAFRDGPVERVGAILNASPAATRDAVLDGLDQEDAVFAQKVRKAIFTFQNIPARIAGRDIPKVARAVDQEVLIVALGHGKATAPDAVTYILWAMSQRLSAQLEDEINEKGAIKPAEGEAAMQEIVTAIREMETSGEILLLSEDE